MHGIYIPRPITRNPNRKCAETAKITMLLLLESPLQVLSYSSEPSGQSSLELQSSLNGMVWVLFSQNQMLVENGSIEQLAE